MIDRSVILFSVGVLVIFGSIIFFVQRESTKEAEKWILFSKENNCKKIGHMKGGVNTGIGFGAASSGQFGTIVTTNVEPDKTGYKCDDGVTYWR